MLVPNEQIMLEERKHVESGEREIGRERLQEGEEGEREREKGGRVSERECRRTNRAIHPV